MKGRADIVGCHVLHLARAYDVFIHYILGFYYYEGLKSPSGRRAKLIFYVLKSMIYIIFGILGYFVWDLPVFSGYLYFLGYFYEYDYLISDILGFRGFRLVCILHIAHFRPTSHSLVAVPLQQNPKSGIKHLVDSP